jgi:NAD(P)H-hydrate repair Nnr-like enzyme with NAD(P)H-hydrate dehydratase domain
VLGAFAHGLAGRSASLRLGEGTVASDVLARLPEELAQLGR